MLGDVQRRIINDSYKKKYFTPDDFLKYYFDSNKARLSFDKLVAEGYFEKGIHRQSGMVVYTSKNFKGRQKSLDEYG